MANLTPYRIATPEPIATKCGTIDYVRERIHQTNFGTNPSTGLLGKWVKYNVFVPNYLYPFSKTRAQVRPVDVLFSRDSSKDMKSRKGVLFWGYKT